MTSTIKYEEWLALWLKSKRGFVKESTYANYSMAIVNHIMPKLGKYLLHDLTEDVLQKTVMEWSKTGNMSGGGLSKKTIQDFLSIIKLSIKAASKRGLTEPALIMDIQIPVTNNDKRVVIFDREVQNKIMNIVSENPKPRSVGIIVSLLTGLRIGELCALKWSDIDFDQKMISVTKTMQRIYLKEMNGERSSYVTITSPKTRSSNRIIPISSTLLPYLESIKPDDKESFIITGTKDRLEPRTYRSYYNRFLSKNGIDRIKFHGLRHTFATRCIEGGADCKTVSVLLGHASISMTLNMYVHPGMEQKRKCVELIRKD
jgi:Site-specific recombinase XerD